MFRSDPNSVATPIEGHPWFASLSRVAAGLTAILAIAAFHAMAVPLVPLLTFGVFLILVAQGLANRYPHDVLGLCNVVTLTRAAIVAFLAGAVFDPGVSVWLVFTLATVAFALDGVDGWLARRSGLTSDFGARFDMETDSALAAVLALWLLTSGTTGPEIIILGFTRYAFVLASLVLPALRADLPPAFRRKAICGIQIAALIILLCPLSPAGLLPLVSIGASILLIWSFAVDIIWLLRRAP